MDNKWEELTPVKFSPFLWAVIENLEKRLQEVDPLSKIQQDPNKAGVINSQDLVDSMVLGSEDFDT